MADENFVKIAFELQQDEDGYPPDKYETLWAVALGQDCLYRLDNIPLYVKGVSSEDIVLAESKEGRLEFVRLVEPSSNSVYRVFVTEESDVQAARDRFRALGCESEKSYVPRLFTMEIPGSVSIEPVEALLEEGAASGRWEYENGVLRHQVPA
jgi:Domain of unknown function (DUF4265)